MQKMRGASAPFLLEQIKIDHLASLIISVVSRLVLGCRMVKGASPRTNLYPLKPQITTRSIGLPQLYDWVFNAGMSFTEISG